MFYSMPRVVIAGLSGGSGKTLVSAGLARALSRKGYKVQTFKKGPDYIDTLWLSLASGYPPRNLDPYMTKPAMLPRLFADACKASSALPDIAIIEGNRGLFDGQDLSGSASTAEVARQLSAPVVLAMNCAKMTRTAAAIVMGMKAFEPDLNLAGVILNQVSRSRHRSIVKQAVEQLAGVNVLGLVPRRAEELFEERSCGLCAEEAALSGSKAMRRLDAIADFIEEHVDIAAIVALAESAPPLEIKEDSGLAAQSGFAAQATAASSAGGAAARAGRKPRIGYVRDRALWFYYTENLEALRAAGADLVPLSLLGGTWPALDALYLGGGFPGDFAAALAADEAKKAEVAALVRAGLPTYAEGPGFYYLTRSINIGGASYPMAGVFDFDLHLGKVPRGIGYVEAVVENSNPFHPVGSIIRAHEFHYTDIGVPGGLYSECVMRMNKGAGMFYAKGRPGRDGLLKHNCFISHMQVFAPGAPHWAVEFVKAALK